MNIANYLIDQTDYDWGSMLSEWRSLLPEEFTLWMVNRFGDLFIVANDGSVLLLDVGAGTLRQLAKGQSEFADQIDEGNNANEWLLIPLVDACVATGMTLSQGQCYSYVQPPMLGGEYSVENVEVCDIEVHYSLFGQIYAQIKDLPDGTAVKVRPDVDDE